MQLNGQIRRLLLFQLALRKWEGFLSDCFQWCFYLVHSYQLLSRNLQTLWTVVCQRVTHRHSVCQFVKWKHTTLLGAMSSQSKA